MMMKGMPRSRRRPAAKIDPEALPTHQSQTESQSTPKTQSDAEDTTAPCSPIRSPVMQKPLTDLQREEDLDFLAVYLRDQWSPVCARLGAEDPEALFRRARKKWFEETFAGLATKPEPELLQKPVYCYSPEQLEALRGDPKAQVIVLKSFLEKWRIDNRLFGLEHIEQTYGDFECDIRVQDPVVEGFNMRSSRYQQEVEAMLVRDYVRYQKAKQYMSLQDEAHLDKKIKFAVNLDIGNFRDQLLELYNKVPPWLFCNREADVQTFLRRHIPGMSIPQIYLKVAGCWTGGHQENLSLRAVNINHGPGEVEWYCMEVDEAYRFNEEILARKKLNLLKMEGLWYFDLKDILKQGFRASKFVQQEGDVVVLAPGTLHWVRSYSYTVNSAWNIGYFDFNQLREVFRRYEFNLKHSFVNLIPVRTLTLDLLNNAHSRFDQQSLALLQKKLAGYLCESKKVLAEVHEKLENIESDNNEINNIVMCSQCRGETFECWLYDNRELEKDLAFDAELIRCHKCFFKGSRPNEHGKIARGVCFVKYAAKDIDALLARLDAGDYFEGRPGPIFPKWLATKFYAKNAVSEFYRAEGGSLKPLESDASLFEDPVLVIREKNFLSRKMGMQAANTFDRDAIEYKIKRKPQAPQELPSPGSPAEKPLLLQKQEHRRRRLSEDSEASGCGAAEGESGAQRVVAAAVRFVEQCPEYELKLDASALQLEYRAFAERSRPLSGEMNLLTSLLKEERFASLASEEQKLKCLFVYFDKDCTKNRRELILYTRDSSLSPKIIEAVRSLNYQIEPVHPSFPIEIDLHQDIRATHLCNPNLDMSRKILERALRTIFQPQAV